MLKKIIETMTKEFEEYKKELMSLDNDKILEQSYQYTIKNELLEMFQNAYHYDYYLCISDYYLEKLSTFETPLSFLYNEWLDVDININSQLNEFLETLHF